MKDYCNITFGKSLDSLTYEDIILFFQEEREESNILEFKSGQTDVKKFDDILNKKIIRTIASFLNSEGGLLIWGSPREQYVNKAGKNVKIAIGDLEPNLVFNEKEQLINKIIKTISYMPTGVYLKTLENDESYIYIFEVQESEAKPHQYSGQYLIRIDGQTIPAPHYLVDSMFKQIKDADVEEELYLINYIEDLKYITFNFKMRIFNFNRYIVAKNVNANLYSNMGELNTTGSRNINIETIDSISFGTFPSTDFSLLIKKDLMDRFNNEIELNITTSAHNSLSKISKYEINLKIENSYQLEKSISNKPLIDLIGINSNKEEIKKLFI